MLRRRLLLLRSPSRMLADERTDGRHWKRGADRLRIMPRARTRLQLFALKRAGYLACLRTQATRGPSGAVGMTRRLPSKRYCSLRVKVASAPP